MEYSERSSEPIEELRALLQGFVASGYAPSGAEVEGDEPGANGHGHGHGHGTDGSTRRFEYRGHEVEIVTHYAVTIDGEPWDGQLLVRNDGTVIYHGLPQYAVPSAVDLIRGVIDTGYEAPEEVRNAIRAAREEE
jgi:hypothetical protein